MTNIINVRIKDIIPDPEIPLFRGPIHSTVALQESIRLEGIQQPLWARQDPKNASTYYLIDGNRRLHACRQLGIKEVPVLVKGVNAHGARCLALVANQTEKFPDIVLDKEGAVIGGNCLAAKLEVDRPDVRRYMVAEWMGVPSDTIGALYRLFSESVAVKRKVEKGHLAITVYSLFKTAPDDVKEHLANRPGHVSANVVRRTLRDWDDIQAKIQGKQEIVFDIFDNEVLDDPLVPVPVDEREVVISIRPVDEEVTVAFCLNKAISWLHKINGHDITPTDWFLLEKLDSVYEGIKEDYAHS